MTIESSSGVHHVRVLLLELISLLVLAFSACPAHAQSITCTPSATTVSFGPYDVLSGLTVAGVGSFTVTCTSVNAPRTTVTYTAKLPAPGTTARNMAPPSGTDRVAYGLYSDAAHTAVWGDGTGGTTTFTGSMTVRRNRSVTSGAINYYGLITPGGQDVSAASPGPAPTTYTQNLTITVTCTPVPPC